MFSRPYRIYQYKSILMKVEEKPLLQIPIPLLNIRLQP